jgi:hypothetical protein
MIFPIALAFLLGGSRYSDPPDSLGDLYELFDPLETERLDREHLEWTRSRLAGLEEIIEWREKSLKDRRLFTPAEAERLRQRLEVWRETARFMKRYLGELENWEQQRRIKPGRETDQAAFRRAEALHRDWEAAVSARRRGLIAPPPREVKR